VTESLKTERLVLRRWREADREAFRAMNGDPRVMEFMPKALTTAESDAMMERMERHFERHGFGLFAAEVRGSGELAGFVGLSVPGFEAPFMPAVEIGWRLAAEYWGRGLATEGAREALRWGFEELGLDEVVSFTAEGNARSRRVMELLGMTHDATDDFEHPGLAEGHRLRRQVLYRMRRVGRQTRPSRV